MRSPLVLQVLVILQKASPLCGPVGRFRLGPRLAESYPGRRGATPPPSGGGDTIGGGVAARRPEPYIYIYICFSYICGVCVPLPHSPHC